MTSEFVNIKIQMTRVLKVKQTNDGKKILNGFICYNINRFELMIEICEEMLENLWLSN